MFAVLYIAVWIKEQKFFFLTFFLSLFAYGRAVQTYITHIRNIVYSSVEVLGKHELYGAHIATRACHACAFQLTNEHARNFHLRRGVAGANSQDCVALPWDFKIITLCLVYEVLVNQGRRCGHFYPQHAGKFFFEWQNRGFYIIGWWYACEESLQELSGMIKALKLLPKQSISIIRIGMNLAGRIKLCLMLTLNRRQWYQFRENVT